MTDLNGFLFNENCDTILALHVTVAHMNIYMSIVKLDCAICDKESTIGVQTAQINEYRTNLLVHISKEKKKSKFYNLNAKIKSQSIEEHV